MALDSTDYAGSICEVRSMQNALMAIGMVKEVLDGELILLSARGQSLPILRYRAQVKATMMARETDNLTILVGVVFTSTEEQLHLSELITLENYERRNFFRVNVKTPVLLTAVKEGGKAIAVTMIDVSLGGCLLEAQQELQVGGHYIASFTMVQVPHEVELIISRITQQADEESSKYRRYGCSFDNNSERRMDAICKDLFILQRRIIQNKRGL